MENEIEVRGSRDVTIYDTGNTGASSKIEAGTPIKLLVEWVLEFIDDSLDETVIRRIFDEGYVTDDNERWAADEEDIYITIWTILVRTICDRAIDNLDLHNAYDSIDASEQVQQFMGENESEIEIMLEYKTKRILSKEGIMYIRREGGHLRYINPVQTEIMKGV